MVICYSIGFTLYFGFTSFYEKYVDVSVDVKLDWGTYLSFLSALLTILMSVYFTWVKK